MKTEEGSSALKTGSSPRVWEWALLIFLFCVMRFGGLLFFHPAFNDLCPLEEYYRGVIAHEILKGSWSPEFIWNLRADNFGGGSLVMGSMAAVFFKLFGPSAFVLRSIPVLISLGALLLWFQMISRGVSKKTAWYFSLFFIFSPPIFQSWSMAPLGDHYETIFISAIAVWLFLKIHKFEILNSSAKKHGRIRLLFGGKSETNPKSKIQISKRLGFWISKFEFVSNFVLRISNLQHQLFFSFILGLVCGFGVWFAYIFALTIMTLLLWGLIKDPRLFFRPKFWIGTLGFFIGLLPWFYLNYSTNLHGLYIHDRPLWKCFEPLFNAGFWERYFWERNFLRDVFEVFTWAEIGWKAPRFLVNCVYVVLLMTPLAVLIFLKALQKSVRPGGEEQAGDPLLRKGYDLSLYFSLYAFLHLLAVQVTQFEGNRYMLPLFPSLFYAWARLMDSIESYSRQIQFANRLCFVSPLLLLGGVLWVLMLAPDHAGHLLKRRGVAYDYAASIPEYKMKHLSQEFQGLSREEQREFWTGLSYEKAGALLALDTPAEIRSELSAMEFPSPEYAALFYFNLGRQLYMKHDNLKRAYAELMILLDPQSTEFVLSRNGLYFMFGFKELAVMQLLGHDPPPDENLEGYFRALGRQIARHWWEGQTKIDDINERVWDRRFGIREMYRRVKEAFPSGLAEEKRRGFFQGLGSFFVRNTYKQPVLGPGEFEKAKLVLDPEDRELFFRGVGRAYETSYLFLRKPCRTWCYDYLPPIEDPEILKWMELGKEEIRSVLRKFYQEYALRPQAIQETPIIS